ncbi:DUF2304 domain-containing protein [Vibrio rotiferianus]|uniref:DUF2304 domain-containing protein n=1 Tax=Vibrio rotiferianus TaxID=190895 RepID=UPI002894E690|nr:conserved membrane hypothetical protein [Vibrio rotiferianus]
MHYQIFSALIGLSFFVIAFLLVRRDTILPGSALRWTLLSSLILILGLFPQLSDVIATAIGVAYPPIIPVIFAIIILFLKFLLSDIERSKDRIKIERLIQRVAMLEQKIESNSKKK